MYGEKTLVTKVGGEHGNQSTRQGKGKTSTQKKNYKYLWPLSCARLLKLLPQFNPPPSLLSIFEIVNISYLYTSCLIVLFGLRAFPFACVVGTQLCLSFRWVTWMRVQCTTWWNIPGLQDLKKNAFKSYHQTYTHQLFRLKVNVIPYSQVGHKYSGWGKKT